jgi:hypothetical protein
LGWLSQDESVTLRSFWTSLIFDGKASLGRETVLLRRSALRPFVAARIKRSEDQAMKNLTSKDLEHVRDQHEAWLRALPGVVGTGIGMDKSGQISLKVFSNRISAETRNAITERLGSVPVAIEETGEIRKQV